MNKLQSTLYVPEGMRYERELIDISEEQALVAQVSKLPFKEFEFHGYLGKRRVVSFGWKYEFSGKGQLRKADEIPEFLLPLREKAAAFAEMNANQLQHVLVIEYGPGAGIGWHRDKPVFDEVVGVSLLAPCVIRFRRKIKTDTGIGKATNGGKGKSRWERFNLSAEPRSAYHLTGPARSHWEHSISSVAELRYSITFRSMNDTQFESL